MAFQDERSREICSGGKDQPAFRRKITDGSLNCYRIIVETVTHSAERAHINSTALLPGVKNRFLLCLARTDRKMILRIRLQRKQGKNIAFALELLHAIQHNRKPLRSIVRQGILQLKAG